MSTCTQSAPVDERRGMLLLARSEGEGFSVGLEHRVAVRQVSGRSVTVQLSTPAGAGEWTLRKGDSLDLGSDGQTTRASAAQRSGTDPTCEQSKVLLRIHVMRISSNDVRLAIHAPKSMAIRRFEHAGRP